LGGGRVADGTSGTAFFLATFFLDGAGEAAFFLVAVANGAGERELPLSMAAVAEGRPPLLKLRQSDGRTDGRCRAVAQMAPPPPPPDRREIGSGSNYSIQRVD